MVFGGFAYDKKLFVLAVPIHHSCLAGKRDLNRRLEIPFLRQIKQAAHVERQIVDFRAVPAACRREQSGQQGESQNSFDHADPLLPPPDEFDHWFPVSDPGGRVLSQKGTRSVMFFRFRIESGEAGAK